MDPSFKIPKQSPVGKWIALNDVDRCRLAIMRPWPIPPSKGLQRVRATHSPLFQYKELHCPSQQWQLTTGCTSSNSFCTTQREPAPSSKGKLCLIPCEDGVPSFRTHIPINQWPLYGTLYPIHRTHRPKDQEVEVGVAPLIITPSDILAVNLENARES